MKRRILMVSSVIVCFLSITSITLPYGVSQFPIYIKSPEQLANWLHSEFTYEFKIPDYKQTVDETLARRSGDCEDFASLSQKVLSDLGINNEIVIIKFRQLKIMHAVCGFKEGATYSFISNREMIRTSGHSIGEAIAETFPDWDSLALLTADGQYSQTIKRGSIAD